MSRSGNTFRTFPALFCALVTLLPTVGGQPALAQNTGDGISIESVRDLSDLRPPAGSAELFRLRIVNRRDGVIQVSTDAGANWRLIGRVLNPATTISEGYTAAQYIEPGTVAAIAVHGLRLRVGADNKTLHDPLVLSIDPLEYAGEGAQNPDRGYGGQVTGSAGIQTDIPAGTSIFRDLAPLVGSPVCLESSTGALSRMPENYRPKGMGEVIVILAQAPINSLVETVFENRAGGNVSAKFADGTTKVLTQVIQPVRGVGRFDGTSYTGVGRLNTDHTGVITVSTAPIDTAGGAPEGTGHERRGGFQIQPAWHNARLEEAGAFMVMTLGTAGTPRHRELEATPPLFRSAIGLGDAPEPADASAAASDAPTPAALSTPPDNGQAIVDISIDNGPWEPMPALVGSLPDVFSAAGLNRWWKTHGESRTCTQGATAFRLRLPRRSPERSRLAALAAVDAYRDAHYAAARAGGLPIVRGMLTINANPTNREGVSYVRLRVEGQPRGFTNVSPFALYWDTRSVPDGDYLLEADALDDGGRLLATTRRRVFVLNHPPTPRPTAETRTHGAAAASPGKAKKPSGG